ncbi:MAG TPA: glycosyltransferase [Pyrinomonadaceae bacterium]|nr:glycosyltransferase [Pyrinomonadaceae bacterium]
MRPVLTNFGTTGDIQPFLALGVEFKQHGHEPVLALSPYFGSRVKDLGLDFVAIGPDLQKVQSEIITAVVTRHIEVEELRRLFTPLSSALPQMYEELREVCLESDVLVSGPTQAAARIVHETTGIPFASIQLDHYGGGGRPAFQQASALLINPFRKKLGLSALRNPLMKDANSAQLTLYAMSRHVIPRPRNWPVHYHMTGYFFLDSKDWRPDDALVGFIDDGEPPFIITLGSTSYENIDALSDLILQAVNRANCRAIVQQGWSGLGLRKALPSNVHVVGYLPHDWLFPRAACVVHHGGVGSAASVFRAGIPSIFITHGTALRAKFAEELGCAGPSISIWELTAKRLGEAMSQTRDNPAFYHAASVLGEKIQNEHGVKNARNLIEDLVSGAAPVLG